MTVSPILEVSSSRAGSARIHTMAATVVILIGSAVLLFGRLGHYEFWDDEAITAMTARSVWNTGDTDARVDDHNILGYRNGLLLKEFKDRYTPPFQFYLLAPFVGLFGTNTFACRLPFAIAGLIGVGIMLRWLWRSNPSPLLWWAAAIAILTNVEYFLFARQCRYYSLATTLTIWVAYLYMHRDGRRSTVIWLSLSLVLLLASQYMNYAALALCLGLDYLIWGRKKSPFTWSDWAILLLPQLIVGAVVCSIWNPLAHNINPVAGANVLQAKIWMLRWTWRDMLVSSFGIALVIVLCPLTYFIRPNSAVLRATLALVVYATITALLMVAPTDPNGNAELRYLAPVTPLCIAMAILFVHQVEHLRFRSIALTAAMLGLLLQPVVTRDGPSSRPAFYLFYKELLRPPADSYTQVAAWINKHVTAGQSIWMQPQYMTYPLMLRANKAVYAWQFTDPPNPEYAALPDIQFLYRTGPDYMIAFGPFQKEVLKAQAILARRGINYAMIDTIPFYWQDSFRPEIIWRRFWNKTPKPDEAIYMYKRIDAPR